MRSVSATYERSSIGIGEGREVVKVEFGLEAGV